MKPMIHSTSADSGPATAHDRERAAFRAPSAEFGILPFWFLNGELDPAEMRWQLRELADKGMHGVILHGRYGLEMPYLSGRYLERIKLAVDEARALGLAVWIYDEMNWPSGTADKLVLKARPDLAQRFIECISFTVEGPWFMCLTGEDSRYLDFERSTPVAAFAIGEHGEVIDLTPNLSFEKVVPWEVPAGTWRLAYVVEKRAEYYIDALDPQSTRTFIELGYDPYLRAVNGHQDAPQPVAGFYSDEPAMHYFLTGGDNPILPWTANMFRRFRERNGYELRPRLADLFFDLRPDSARIRHDFFNTTTELYTNAYYRQLREWCRAHGTLFTAHLLYEEWLRPMIRVEGNLFRHYENMDVVAVDHLYPVIGSRERPDQHVAMKVASSAAHQFGSERLICESFGGIFMDATMQRMKWIADWEYVLGVNLLNPHGFHYTLEGARKRDWPPSQFYQYPYWRHYQGFNDYISRLSRLLSGGRHVARVAVLWPINAMFATYRPQERDPVGERTEQDFNALTDLLLRTHTDFDYLDEDVLARAGISDGAVVVGDECYEAVIIPPMAHCRVSTVTRLEELVAAGGNVLGMVLLPADGFEPGRQVDLSGRLDALFGVDPRATAGFAEVTGAEVEIRRHASGGAAAFVRAAAVAGQAVAGFRSMAQHSVPGTPGGVAEAIRSALASLVPADVEISNDELFSLHRRKDGQDLFFVINPTFTEQRAEVSLPGTVDPVLWDPSTGQERLLAPSAVVDGCTRFTLSLPPAGSAVILPRAPSGVRVTSSDVVVDAVTTREISGHGPRSSAAITVERDGREHQLTAEAAGPPEPTVVLDGDWEFRAEQPNALVLDRWLALPEGDGSGDVTSPDLDDAHWLPVVPGAWAYQLPAEPDRDWPIPVWYRAAFEVTDIPSRLHLVLDGFAGEDRMLFLNRTQVTGEPERSPFDSQMHWVELPEVREGRNVLAVRLTLTGPTGGLVDRVKLAGEFAVTGEPDSPRLTRPAPAARPDSWVDQGYPFYSGVGSYRCRFAVPGQAAAARWYLEVPMRDDCLEVTVNGGPAGVFLWDPYVAEVTGLVHDGENEIELRVANTLSNLLNADRRPSGLAGPPRLVAHREFVFAVKEAT
jgi:alpha-L-rhamnosidase